MPTSEVSGGMEVLRIGSWSVRRPPAGDPIQSPIYVHLETGRVQREPPPEVLDELASDTNDSGGQHIVTPEDEREDELELQPEDVLEASDLHAPGPPRFRRIVLGARNDMPLRMARDILAALREDISMFDQIQQRFSDVPSEPVLELDSTLDGQPCSSSAASGTPPPQLPPDMEAVASVLQPGELSEVIGTSSGMQILLRVS